MNDTMTQNSTENFISPFADRFSPTQNTPQVSFENGESSISYESPFSSINQSPATSPIQEIMQELHSAEFDNLLQSLVAETIERLPAPSILNNFMNDSRGQYQLTEQNFAPLLEASDMMFDRMGSALNAAGTKLTSNELDQLLSQFAPVNTGLSELQEQFLGNVFKKVSSAVKKGIAAVGKLLPINQILDKIKSLIKPLLARVLKFAINKIPEGLRPIANTLATKLLGTGILQGETYGRNILTPYETQYLSAQVATQDVGNIQLEFDQQLTHIVTGDSQNEVEHMINEYVSEAYAPETNTLGEINQIKENLAERLSNLSEGESPAPIIQEFIPAVLPLLKMGVSIIGRQKVINFLAKYLEDMISKYIGQAQAQMLSRSLVDTGLGMIGFETYEGQEPKKVAGKLLANTMIDTMKNVSQIPQHLLDDTQEMPLVLNEAFEKAVADNFPEGHVKTEVVENQVGSAHEFTKHRSNLYQKYNKTPPVLNLKLSQLNHLKTFGRGTLGNAIRAQLKSTIKDADLEIRLHIYKAVEGTWLSIISKNEKISGLGSALPSAWQKIHPLTTEAAAIFGVPALATVVNPRFLRSRHVIDVGQCFYYLEILSVTNPRQGKPNPVSPVTPPTIVINPPITAPVAPTYPDTFKFYSKISDRRLGFKLYLNDASVQMILNESNNGNRRVAIAHLSRLVRAHWTYDIQFETNEYFIGALAKGVGKDLVQNALKWLGKFILDWIEYEIEIFVKNYLKELKDEMNKPDQGVTINLEGVIGVDIMSLVKLISPITSFTALKITTKHSVKAGYHL